MFFTDFYQKTKPTSSSAADNSSTGGGKSQPVAQLSHSEAQQMVPQSRTPLEPHLHYQAPTHIMESKPATVTRPWVYENLPSEAGQFSSSTSYESQPHPTELFQGATILPFVQPEAEDLFIPLESAVHFQPQQQGVVYSRASGSSSFGSGSSSILPPISSYDDTPPLQPPVIPTTLPPNPYNQPPPF